MGLLDGVRVQDVRNFLQGRLYPDRNDDA
jgi:hypothetical protein